MSRKTVFLAVQSVLCALAAGLLAAAAVELYLDGAAKQAEGDLFYYMYTRERVEAKLLPLLPLLFACLGMAACGLALGIRDENQDRPMRDEKLLRDLGKVRDRSVRRAASPKVLALRTALIALAAVLILAGILNGGLAELLAKGAAVCSECIGLG